MAKAPPFENRDVDAVFAGYPEPLKAKLLTLRRLIFETAARNPQIGALQETLKWGQPSYLTPQTKAGTTIRIDRAKSLQAHYAIYFHCQTNLIERFKEMYRDDFHYEGNRAIVFDENETIEQDKLGHCISLALTYHLDKKQAKSV